MEISWLEWDEDTEEHLARHGVAIEEVYEVCEGRHKIKRVKYGRYGVLGQTESGRYLAAILEKLDRGVFLIVTARDMSKSERCLYKK